MTLKHGGIEDRTFKQQIKGLRAISYGGPCKVIEPTGEVRYQPAMYYHYSAPGHCETNQEAVKEWMEVRK